MTLINTITLTSGTSYGTSGGWIQLDSDAKVPAYNFYIASLMFRTLYSTYAEWKITDLKVAIEIEKMYTIPQTIWNGANAITTYDYHAPWNFFAYYEPTLNSVAYPTTISPGSIQTNMNAFMNMPTGNGIGGTVKKVLGVTRQPTMKKMYLHIKNPVALCYNTNSNSPEPMTAKAGWMATDTNAIGTSPTSGIYIGGLNIWICDVGTATTPGYNKYAVTSARMKVAFRSRTLTVI